MEVTAPLKLAR